MLKTLGNMELRDWLWYGAAALAVATLTISGIRFPQVVSILVVVAILTTLTIRAGRECALGNGVLGAIVSVVLISPTGMGVPFFTGIAVGTAWLLACAMFAMRRIISNRVFGLFAIVTIIGIAGALFLPEIPLLAISVGIFGLLVGVVASSPLTTADKGVIRGGLIVLASVEATLLTYETFVLKGWMFGDPTGWGHPLIEGSYRAAGTVGHPIAAGTVLLVAIGLLMATRWEKQIAKVPVLAVLLVGVFATGSMSVYITAAICLLLPYAAKRSVPAHFMKGALAVLGIVYVTTDQQVFNTISSGIGALNSGHRINTILGIPNLIFSRPLGESLFGTGWGSAQQNYLDGYFVNDNFFTLDNQFVSVLMATGMVGMIIFMIFLGLAWHRRGIHSWVAFIALVMMFFGFDVLSWAATVGLFVVVALDLRPSSETLDSNVASVDSCAAIPVSTQTKNPAQDTCITSRTRMTEGTKYGSTPANVTPSTRPPIYPVGLQVSK
ncbi:O-antigen ligase family protein [Arthrobacter glacialis]|uniref:O-antigen ligase family protein n=1 Tax=Arthrobacter glacialis TaxID=1664 RepID=UPI000CD3E423|nr:hypothetical protein [Arthrobacter glacialis]POH60672.1 hypothetical protein CVS28_03095 [Arthrobacter glacialis]